MGRGLLLSPGTLCVTLHTATVFSWFSTTAPQTKGESCLDRFCRMTNAVMWILFSYSGT